MRDHSPVETLQSDKGKSNNNHLYHTCLAYLYLYYNSRPLRQLSNDSLMMMMILKVKYGFTDIVMAILSNSCPQSIGELLNKFRLILVLILTTLHPLFHLGLCLLTSVWSLCQVSPVSTQASASSLCTVSLTHSPILPPGLSLTSGIFSFYLSQHTHSH